MMWSQLLPRLHPELHLPLPQLHPHGLAVAQDVAAPGGEVDKPAIVLKHWKYLFVLKIFLTYSCLGSWSPRRRAPPRTPRPWPAWWRPSCRPRGPPGWSSQPWICCVAFCTVHCILYCFFIVNLLYCCIVLQPEEAHPVPAGQVSPLLDVDGVDEEHVLPSVVRTSIHKPDREKYLNTLKKYLMFQYKSNKLKLSATSFDRLC